ncbi:MAG TPA: hypothetical protein VF865_17755 [Acidobacteriaceae bacterium]
MLRITRTLASSLVLIAAAAIAPATANASPFGKLLHLHPRAAQPKDDRLTVRIYNRSAIFRDVKVNGHIYTVNAYGAVAVTAPAGTDVFAASSSFGHRKGDLLVTVSPETKDRVVFLN